ncbi:MAG: sialidase family protein [Candidatus Paceibacterota bacterium]
MFTLRFLIILVLISFLASFSIDVFAEQTLATNLSNTIGKSYRPQLFVQGENVYAVWTDDTPGNNEIFFTKSKNGGASFEQPLNLSNNNGSSAFPRLVVAEPNVYVVWYDYSAGQSDIFFAQSNDTGKRFNVIHVQTPQPSFNPWLATWANYVYLVWNDGGKAATIELPNGETRIVDVQTGDEEIIFGHSKDDGQTFEFKNISNTPSKISWNPRIRVDESNVYVVWNEMGVNASAIFFSSSNDNGNSFSDPVNVSNNPRESLDAGIAVNKNKIYLVWNQKTFDSSDIYFSKSNDNGNKFSEPINLSKSKNVSQIIRDTQIAISGDKIFVVWYDITEYGSDVFFTRSVDGGLTFSIPINLSQTNARSELPQIAANNEKVYVVWQDFSQGNGEIFLRESTDAGATFGSIRNLSNNEKESNIFILGPQIFQANNEVYTVWEDQMNNTSDLFLTSFEQSEKKDSTQMLLSTLNETVDIEIDVDGQNFMVNEITNVTLRFFDSKNGKMLHDVNYSFDVFDASGKKTISMDNQYAESGEGILSLNFPQEGPFTIQIDVIGIGIDEPFDTKNSGIASATITVVPEFPQGIIMSMAAMLGLVLVITFYKKRSIR